MWYVTVGLCNVPSGFTNPRSYSLSLESYTSHCRLVCAGTYRIVSCRVVSCADTLQHVGDLHGGGAGLVVDEEEEEGWTAHSTAPQQGLLR